MVFASPPSATDTLSVGRGDPAAHG
jgi:hypothetical protein